MEVLGGMSHACSMETWKAWLPVVNVSIHGRPTGVARKQQRMKPRMAWGPSQKGGMESGTAMIADWRGEAMRPQKTRRSCNIAWTLWYTHKGGIQNDRKLVPGCQSIVGIAWSTKENGTDYQPTLNPTQRNITFVIVCIHLSIHLQ